MEKVILNATPREVGKSASAAERRKGLVPCVLYANGVAPVYFSVTELNLKPLVFTNKKAIATVEVDGKTYDCMIKQIDNHPVTDRPIHVDFQALIPGTKIRTSVPLHTVGTPKGVVAGGALKKVIFKANVECDPANLPTYIPVDVSHLEIGKDIRIKDLAVQGIKFLTDANQSIAKVVTKRASR
ncbi:MAG TPA: 50S ribosomal protein L25 [Bacteroidetes bacterium]|nr:50S ribosomal protein L25 [Bacteroidota bacterium]